MFKKFAVKLTMLSLVLTFCVSELTAQTRINFKRGRSSATVSGNIGASGERRYVLRGKAGQNITVNLNSSTGLVTAATRAASPNTSFDYQLERDGDIYIDVFNEGRATKFTMTVAIR